MAAHFEEKLHQFARMWKVTNFRELVEHTSQNAPQAELRPVLIHAQIGCRLRKPTGKHVLVLSFTGFDPIAVIG